MSSRLKREILARRLAAIAIHLAALAGCGPAITPAPLPSPHVLSIQVTPALLSLQPHFKECADGQPGLGLVLQESGAQSLDPSRSGLVMRWWASDQPEVFAAVVGQEKLVIIAHPQNPLDEISAADLQAVYAGTQPSWPADPVPGGIQAWSYPPGDDIEAVFVDAVLSGSQVSPGAVSLAPGPEEMIEAVSASPGAIGYLPGRWVDERVKVFEVPGVPPRKFPKTGAGAQSGRT